MKPGRSLTGAIGRAEARVRGHSVVVHVMELVLLEGMTVKYNTGGAVTSHIWADPTMH